MTLPRPFKFPKRRKARQAPPRGQVRPATEDEGLTGLVQDMDASDWEERLARAFMKYDVQFEFRIIEFAPVRNIAGAREIDFKVYLDYGTLPLMVDGEFTHKGAKAQADDRMTDALLNEHLKQYGFLPIRRVPDGVTDNADVLETQEAADQFVAELAR